MQQHRKELCNPKRMIFETFLADCREQRGLPARGARLVARLRPWEPGEPDEPGAGCAG
jgi:hypothetical protein